MRRANPERARHERGKTALEAGFLALRGDTLVDTFAKPNVSLHIPRVEENLCIFREFDVPDVDVGSILPLGAATFGVACEAETSLNGSTLDKCRFNYSTNSRKVGLLASVNVQMA